MATSRDHEDQPEEDFSADGEAYFSTYGGLGTNEEVLEQNDQLTNQHVSIADELSKIIWWGRTDPRD